MINLELIKLDAKIKKKNGTSSAITNNDITLSSHIDVNEISSILKETNFFEWKFIVTCETELANYFKRQRFFFIF